MGRYKKKRQVCLQAFFFAGALIFLTGAVLPHCISYFDAKVIELNIEGEKEAEKEKEDNKEENKTDDYFRESFGYTSDYQTEKYHFDKHIFFWRNLYIDTPTPPPELHTCKG